VSILSRIRANGGEVIRDRWQIRLRRGRLTDDAVKWVAERKRDLMREVWPLFDDWEERAAIREFDGEQAQEDAEASAYLEVSGC